MKYAKSGLIIESAEAELSSPIRFSSPSVGKEKGFTVLFSESEDGGFSCRTVESGRIWEGDRRRISDCAVLCGRLISEYMDRLGFDRTRGKLLFAGIGNIGVASDSVGPKAGSKIIVTGKDMPQLPIPEISCIIPGTLAKTGIDTAEQIKLIAEHIDAGLIITADSVCARAAERLQTVIQITDVGTVPGSGTGIPAGNGGITREAMGCPVISLGVPMVIRAGVISDEFADESMLITRAEADIISDCYASIIAGAVNNAVLGNIMQ